jgi:hypothetical protein
VKLSTVAVCVALPPSLLRPKVVPGGTLVAAVGVGVVVDVGVGDGLVSVGVGEGLVGVGDGLGVEAGRLSGSHDAPLAAVPLLTVAGVATVAAVT